MRKENIWRRLMFLLCLGAMMFGGWKLCGIYAEYAEGTETYDDLASQYIHIQEPESPDASGEAETIPVVSFDALLEECSDVVAWIYCADTSINYPIVQSGDNDYYLRRLMNGKYNIGGTLFMDYRNQADCSDWNTIVYGHNMKNGSMFAALPKYQEQAFYEEHPVMYLLTPEQDYMIELIGGYVTPSDSEAYSFPQTLEERNALIEKTCRASSFVSGAEILETDKLITLSTCVYDYDNARYVLVGVLRPVELEEGGVKDE